MAYTAKGAMFAVALLTVQPPTVLSFRLLAARWASEANVLAYELRWARQSPDLSQSRATLLGRWPGVAFRATEIEAGAGLLTRLRREFGADRGSR